MDELIQEHLGRGRAAGYSADDVARTQDHLARVYRAVMNTTSAGWWIDHRSDPPRSNHGRSSQAGRHRRPGEVAGTLRTATPRPPPFHPLDAFGEGRRPPIPATQADRWRTGQEHRPAPGPESTPGIRPGCINPGYINPGTGGNANLKSPVTTAPSPSPSSGAAQEEHRLLVYVIGDQDDETEGYPALADSQAERDRRQRGHHRRTASRHQHLGRKGGHDMGPATPQEDTERRPAPGGRRRPGSPNASRARKAVSCIQLQRETAQVWKDAVRGQTKGLLERFKTIFETRWVIWIHNPGAANPGGAGPDGAGGAGE